MPPNSRKTRLATVQRLFELERKGKYKDALDLIGEKFPPAYFKKNKKDEVFAEALLRYGAILGLAGAHLRLPNAQEESRDLLTRAQIIFEDSDKEEKVAECCNYLAASYSRTGQYDEATAYLNHAGSIILPENSKTRLHMVLLAELVLFDQRRYKEVIELAESEEENFMKFGDSWHIGINFTNMGLSQKNLGLVDDARVSLMGARVYFDLDENFNAQALAENNLAQIFRISNNMPSAHYAINRAIDINRCEGNKRRLGSCLDTKALILYDEGRYPEALKAINESIGILALGDEDAFLEESLQTRKKILAKIRGRD